MRFTDFVKDRLPAYVIYASGGVVLLIFAIAIHVSVLMCIISAVVLFLSVAGAEIREFVRKRRFYDNLLTNMKELDKKYLIAETTECPVFYEGKLLYEILRETDKSMCENVSEYRRENASFREFIEMWVHEVKLPVASLQLILHNGEDTAKALEQLRRIDSYTDTVLYYARSENAEKDYVITEIPLKRAVNETVIKFRDDLTTRGFTIVTDIPDITVMTDGKWFGYILGQLISNSLKYCSGTDAPEISVTVEDMREYVRLHFRDNGIGIPASDLPRIFDRSFTGENGRKGAKSTGMGLYIVKNLCTKLGHRIDVQ
ncbi:MAG: sensor histidine kinase, partial [Ruminiclostridium sp.]|nr:sensor histidine kinase [Ruminiclostridium sp.]